jgi:hypothetical protein
MKERYLELKTMADRIEQIRLELWQSEEHEQYMDDKEEKDYVDNKLFSIQSQLRDVAEFCQIGIF